jgi:hypothetical protein
MQMNADTTSMIMSLTPWLIISAFYAWGNYYLAERTGRSGILYAVLTLIPGFGFGVTVYLFYRALIFILDRLSATQRP